MTLRDLPPVRALAEERAQRQTDAERAAARANGWGYVASKGDKIVRIEAHLDILCNLRDYPDSRDAVARLVAGKVGWQGWQVTQAIEDGGVEWVELCNCATIDGSAIEAESDTDVLTRIALAVLA